MGDSGGAPDKLWPPYFAERIDKTHAVFWNYAKVFSKKLC